MARVTWLLIAAVGSWGAVALAGDQVKRDERVILFDTAARFDQEQGIWRIPIHGWIFEPEHDDVLRRSLVNLLGAGWHLDNDEQRERFERRMQWFLADNERGKRLQVRLAGQVLTMPASTPGGHFRQEVRIDAEDVEQAREGAWLPMEIVTASTERRRFRGRTRLIPPTGHSVICDIDDTVKVTDATDWQLALRRTLLQPFEVVEGSAPWLAIRSQQGAALHFVSNSPWQLYRPLQAFLDQHAFPDRVMHLQNFRLQDGDWKKLFSSPKTQKLERVRELLENYPRHQFTLVGDTGQADPEVYGDMARAFPGRVKEILLRNVSGETRNSARMQAAFAKLPDELWKLEFP